MKRASKIPTDVQSELSVLLEQLGVCARDGGGRRVYSDELAERVGRYALSRREEGVGLTAVARRNKWHAPPIPQKLRPSTGITLRLESSMPSRHRTLRATVEVPSGRFPNPKGAQPQVEQKWC